MSDAPERIWATVNGHRTSFPCGERYLIGGWAGTPAKGHATEYVRADRLLSCDGCGHLFDASDKRAFIDRRPEPAHKPLCPLCATFKIRGAEAWAVWNDCQGIFAETVEPRRAAAQALAASEPYLSARCSVVPVRCYREPEDREFFREMQEAAR